MNTHVVQDANAFQIKQLQLGRNLNVQSEVWKKEQFTIEASIPYLC